MTNQESPATAIYAWCLDPVRTTLPENHKLVELFEAYQNFLAHLETNPCTSNGERPPQFEPNELTNYLENHKRLWQLVVAAAIAVHGESAIYIS